MSREDEELLEWVEELESGWLCVDWLEDCCCWRWTLQSEKEQELSTDPELQKDSVRDSDTVSTRLVLSSFCFVLLDDGLLLLLLWGRMVSGPSSSSCG